MEKAWAGSCRGSSSASRTVGAHGELPGRGERANRRVRKRRDRRAAAGAAARTSRQLAGGTGSSTAVNVPSGTACVHVNEFESPVF
jgi:hypothetical protein